MLVGHCLLQGRSKAAPDASYVIIVRVQLTPQGQAAPSIDQTTTTDRNGQFSIRGITPGAYTARVKGSHTLQVSTSLTLAAGTNAEDFGPLPEGDANDDNVVNAMDLSVLATSFMRGSSRADFNQDGTVNAADLSVLAHNFGKMGQ